MEISNQGKDYTLSARELNKGIFRLILPFAILLSIPYLIMWDHDLIKNCSILLLDQVFITLAILITGIFLHEFLHGITWCLLSKKKLNVLKFGISARSLSPYCHMGVPIQLNYYIWGSVMPSIILGAGPLIFSWITGKTAFFLFGMVFFLASGSDLLICIKLRRINKKSIVQDFPDKPGCYIVS